MDTSFPNDLERNVVRTIALGDVVDTALTALEVWQQLDDRASFADVNAALEALSQKNVIIEYRGRYALRGRGILFAERSRRYRASVSKWRKARFFLTLLSALPGVSAVGFYNALGYGNARPGSDIDIVVIAKKQWIWRTRLLSVVMAELVGHRPKQGSIRDGLCLSFFMTPDADLSTVKQGTDPFLSWWLTRMNVVYDRDGAYRQWFETNHWITPERPNMALPRAAEFLNEQAVAIMRTVFGVLFSPLALVSDHYVKKISRSFGSATLWSAAAAKNTSVVMHDDLLKLHLTDRREVHAQEFERRAAKTLKHLAV